MGSSIAFSLMQRGLYSELVLIDANQAKAEGEAMDLSHGLPYAASMQIYAGTYDDVADCAMVILTAGANQKPGETRLDLIDKNVAILKSIIPELTKRLFQGILLVVSNPVDVLTYAAWKLSGLPAKHVIGSGTVLDTARLKYLLGQYLQVDSRNRRHHRRARGQRAGGVEQRQHLQPGPGPLLPAAGKEGLPGRAGPHLPRGAGQRL